MKSRILISCGFADDQGHTSATYSPSGIGKGAGIVQRLLQQIHHMFKRQDAERKLVTQRLQPSRTRHWSIERKQWQQSATG